MEFVEDWREKSQWLLVILSLNKFMIKVIFLQWKCNVLDIWGTLSINVSSLSTHDRLTLVWTSCRSWSATLYGFRNIENGEIEKSAVAAHTWKEKHAIDRKPVLLKLQSLISQRSNKAQSYFSIETDQFFHYKSIILSMNWESNLEPLAFQSIM